MNTKIFEIRDKGTFILAIGIDMNPTHDSERNSEVELASLRRCGYPCDGRPNILLTRLDGGAWASNDPYFWNGRTFPVAHRAILENWHALESGALIDVEFILGETPTIKESEL